MDTATNFQYGESVDPLEGCATFSNLVITTPTFEWRTASSRVFLQGTCLLLWSPSEDIRKANPAALTTATRVLGYTIQGFSSSIGSGETFFTNTSFTRVSTPSIPVLIILLTKP